MKKVLLTGATGLIGTIVCEDLSSTYDLHMVARRWIPAENFTSLDLSRKKDFGKLKDVMKGCDAVVHLAYCEEDHQTSNNFMMTKHISRAALETTPHPRLIMASSIHVVGAHIDWTEDPYRLIVQKKYTRFEEQSIEPLGIDTPPAPNGIYAALKCYIEALGQFYSTEGLEVVVIRFGAVRTDDCVPDEPGCHSCWLSRRDCAQVISKAIDAKLRNKYTCVYAVSNNACRVYDISGARELLGYEPED